jgi:hypothetical protein
MRTETEVDEHRFHFLGLATVDGPAVHVGQTVVTPIARALTVRCPWGGIFYAWPSAVRVSVGGHTSRLRIVNANRRAQAIVFATILVAAWSLIRSSRKETPRWTRR